ncbi:2-amino-4-hydroxy-6-hydroxymethyldihydropteridine diphosphokinase [Psychrobacter sp. SZ93C1]|nr:2-amino-4-hydroxy-6-hydroxymethyldihydropteridine diphosphokinase [Psychrobacter sp. SZ93C1]
MHKVSMDLNLAMLKQCLPEQLQMQSVTAVMLALGSNYQADKHLPRVRKDLAALGEILLSTPFQNPDFTATIELPKPDYTNQCACLRLAKPVTLQQLQALFKQMEGECGRERLVVAKTLVKKVTMDIDILLIETFINKNSLSDNSSSNQKSEWLIMADRYPFKAHERAGIEELISVNSLLLVTTNQ